MMLTLLNVGNTHTQIAEWDGSALTTLRLLKTPELQLSDLPDSGPVAGASVVPDVLERLAGRGIFWLNSRVHTGLKLEVNGDTLGSDRLANAIALAGSYPLPGLVVDCGTAITFELVTADRALKGGAIAPGRALMRRALNLGTAQLPRVELSSHLPAAIGATTVAAIQSGVDRGAVGLIREIIAGITDETGALASVVGVGGDAGFFLRAFPEMRDGGIMFTLDGIRRAWEMNQR